MSQSDKSENRLTLVKRIEEFYERRTTSERALLQKLDDKLERYEKEIRNLRQKNYGQQIEIRSKESLLKESAIKEAETEAYIAALKSKLTEAEQQINLLIGQKKEFQTKIATVEGRFNELQDLCQKTAGTLKKSARLGGSGELSVAGTDDSGMEQ